MLPRLACALFAWILLAVPAAQATDHLTVNFNDGDVIGTGFGEIPPGLHDLKIDFVHQGTEGSVAAWGMDMTGNTWWEEEGISGAGRTRLAAYAVTQDDLGWVNCEVEIAYDEDLGGAIIHVANVLFPCKSLDTGCSLEQEGEVFIDPGGDATVAVTVHHGLAGELKILGATSDLEVLNPDETPFTPVPITGSGVQTVLLLLRASSQFSGQVTLTASFLQTGADCDSQDVVIVREFPRPVVTINTIDPKFAPIYESCRINYTIEEPDGMPVVAARLEVFNDLGDRILLDDDIEIGEDIDYDWEGEGASPEWSPYLVFVEASTDADYTRSGRDAGTTEVLVGSVEVNRWPSPEDPHPDRFIVNNPKTYAAQFRASVTLLNKAGSEVPAHIPVRVYWTEQPGGQNTHYLSSFKYNPVNLPDVPLTDSIQYLGKDGGGEDYFDPMFSTTALLAAVTEDGDLDESTREARATVDFLPSGVGGDQYAVKGAARKHDETELASGTTESFPVWRSISFNQRIHEMLQVTHLTEFFGLDGGSNVLQETFDPAFVLVETDHLLVNKILPPHNVEYVGLWRDNPDGLLPSDFQKDWAELQQKLPAEEPAPGDNDAAVQQKAQQWADRILAEYSASLAAWGARYPNSIVGVEALHPKFDPGGGQTFQWGDYPNIRVVVRGRQVHPDANWGEVLGLHLPASSTVIVASYTGAWRDLGAALAHEIGHATKVVFPRDVFGPGDHTPAEAGAGLMLAAPGEDDLDFIEPELSILRGIVP